MTDTPDLTLERVFASPSLEGASPRKAKLSPDGRFLTLLRNREDDKDRYDLWGFDRESGEWVMLVDSEQLGTGRELGEEEKMQRERARIGNLKGVVDYSWSPDSQSILVPLDGDLYLKPLTDDAIRLTDSPEGELNPTVSPKGSGAAFVREGALYVTSDAAREFVRITPEEASDTVSWGTAEFVAQEEMGRDTGYWWAPDDSRIAVQRTENAPVGIVTRAAIGATGTKTFDQRYPVAGSDNALVELFVMDPDGGNRVKVDLGAESDIYLTRVNWGPGAKRLYVQRQNREQTVLDVLAVDPATGESRVLFTEKAAPDSWINLSDGFHVLEEDGRILWWSERDGHGHIWLFDPSARGKDRWQQVTEGDWEVAEITAVDEKRGLVYFTGNKDGVLERHLYRTSFFVIGDSGQIERLTERGWWNEAVMDKEAESAIITRSNTGQPAQVYYADADGNRLSWVEENALDTDHPYAPFLASHVTPEFGTIKAEDGTKLDWMMIKPQMEPGKQYPVLYYHYGGPHSQQVSKAWKGALAQSVVDKGYIWFVIDNRGAANRGVAFEQPLYRAMGSVEVDDQRAGAEFLKTLPFVDPGKIAIYGWSYGGYMTLKQLEADQGLYAAGISGAPVTRWELYDTHYTERYMGDPNKVPEAYAAASAIPDATNISDPLLLIHGMADDNVVFENSSELISTLQEGNVPFEMMLYPGYTHRVAGENISPHLWNTIFRFLEAHGVTPPE